jgi:fructose-1,6-bisphosphatase II
MDIALDPLEGTNLCAYGRPGALAVIAMAPKGCLMQAPDIYMRKIAVGPVGRGQIDIRRSPAENLEALAKAKGVRVEDLTAMILDRPRHEKLIDQIRRAGARIRLIEDGDVDASIATCKEETGIDILFGIGGAPEGVLSAAALQCMGGEIQGQMVYYNDGERARASKLMHEDIERVLTMDDLAHGDVLFAATGVTTGGMLEGVRFISKGCVTHSLVMRNKSGTVRFIEAEHDFARKPQYTLEGLHEKMEL